MIKEILESKKLLAPNINYNLYELVYTESFWGKKEYLVRAKNRSGVYSNEKKTTIERWRIVCAEINLINWFINVGINRKDFDYIKTNEFKEKVKPYFGTKINDVNYICYSDSKLQNQIKKYWALQLWKYYNNCERLEGIGSFSTMGDDPTMLFLRGYSGYPVGAQTYYWDWPIKFGMVHD